MRRRLVLGAVLCLLLVLVLASGLVGTGAIFSDTETSAGNTFTAGTLDLKVDGVDDDLVAHYDLANMKPGDDTGYYKWCLQNVGSLAGVPWIEFSPIINNDNACAMEPEANVDATCGDGEGELGQYLKPTIGTAPCGWSVPSWLISEWQTGPTHPWGVPGLNHFDSYVYSGSHWPVLDTNDTVGFFLRLVLDENLRNWDGTKWVEVDDNIIQSDGVQFDVIFHLDQQ